MVNPSALTWAMPDGRLAVSGARTLQSWRPSGLGSAASAADARVNAAASLNFIVMGVVADSAGATAPPIRRIPPNLGRAQECSRKEARARRLATPARRGKGGGPMPATDAPRLDRPTIPDSSGHFGPYGGIFVPETLMAALEELEAVYSAARLDPAFQAELRQNLAEFAGRPTPLYYAERLTRHCGGAKIYFKREDLLHTGAHKINNAIGQALLALRMGKKRIIAETGAGQHGVATAAVCAKFGLECVVYMGAVDMERQALNVFRMRLMGAEVRSVDAGQRTLKEA